ncbi:unnamed protein product [Ixodes persulcatus]
MIFFAMPANVISITSQDEKQIRSTLPCLLVCRFDYMFRALLPHNRKSHYGYIYSCGLTILSLDRSNELGKT